MFDMDPGDELALVAETARQLAAEELTPREREAEATHEVGGRLRATYHEIGLAGLELPESAGGAGLGSVARVLVNEELAAGDVGAALALDPLGPALYPWLEMGGDLAPLAEVAERRAGRALLVMASEARVQVDAGRVALEAAWVPAEHAEAVVVLAGEHATLVTEGIAIRPLPGSGLRAAGAGELQIDAAASVVLEDAQGAARARARARLYTASLMLGVMRASCEFSRAYAQQREAFGKPIAHHQALAFLITDMRMALDAARLLVHEAAWRLDAGLPAQVEAASALAQCIEAGRSIGPDGVQILGGHGFMADYPVEKQMRELRVLGLLYGGFDAAVEEAGRRLGTRETPLALAPVEER